MGSPVPGHFRTLLSGVECHKVKSGAVVKQSLGFVWRRARRCALKRDIKV